MISRRVLFASALSLFCACSAVLRPDGGTGPLPEGSQAPKLVAQDHEGRDVALRSAEVTVVYFYPRDGTPGCTKEACAFRDAWQRYVDAGIRVIGVSADSAQKHREFAKEHGLPFSLIADEEHVWSRAFGVGTVAGMARRISFLIDARGTVRRLYDDIDPGVHAAEILNDAKRLGLVR